MDAEPEVDVVESFTGFPLAPGCHLSRNSFALLGYEHKDCCEEPFVTDPWGCLIGGQFNGRLGGSGGSELDEEAAPTRAGAGS